MKNLLVILSAAFALSAQAQTVSVQRPNTVTCSSALKFGDVVEIGSSDQVTVPVNGIHFTCSDGTEMTRPVADDSLLQHYGPSMSGPFGTSVSEILCSQMGYTGGELKDFNWYSDEVCQITLIDSKLQLGKCYTSTSSASGGVAVVTAVNCNKKRI